MAASPYRVVLDSSVLVAGVRSNLGASYRVLSLLPDHRFTPQLSVALAVEYESALSRSVARADFGPSQVSAVVSALCRLSDLHDIYFRWRPFLPDPGDEFVLDLAVKSNSAFIVTHNVRDFSGAVAFGIRVLRPGEFLKVIGANT